MYLPWCCGGLGREGIGPPVKSVFRDCLWFRAYVVCRVLEISCFCFQGLFRNPVQITACLWGHSGVHKWPEM